MVSNCSQSLEVEHYTSDSLQLHNPGALEAGIFTGTQFKLEKNAKLYINISYVVPCLLHFGAENHFFPLPSCPTLGASLHLRQ